MPRTNTTQLEDAPLRDFGTPHDAADRIGLSYKQIQRLALDGRIRFVRRGRALLIYLPSLRDYQQNKSRRGRPPGKP